MRRRKFMKNAGIGASAGYLVSTMPGLSAAESRRWKDKLESFAATSTSYIDETDEQDHAMYEDYWEKHQFQSSSVRLLEVFHTDTYGWEAYVALTGSAFGKSKIDGEWDEGLSSTVSESNFKVINQEPEYYTPDPHEGYRGFTPGSGSDPDNIPDWVEPVFDLSVSTLVTFASSNPYTGAAAGLTLSVDNILSSLVKDDGKSSINEFDNGRADGFKVTHDVDVAGQEWMQKQNTKMTQYQRATLRLGEPQPGTDVKIYSYFPTTWAGQDPPEKTEVEFLISFFDDGDGDDDGDGWVASTGVTPSNMTEQQKREQGIIEVENGEPRDATIQSNERVSNYVEELTDKVEGREVTHVALDPDTSLSSRTTRSN